MDGSYEDLSSDQLREIIKRRDKKIEKLQEKVDDLRANMQDLSKEVEHLNKELRKYSNENTPTSAVPPFNKVTPHHHNRTPGRDNGHEGSGRKLPDTVDETKDAETDKCPDCSGEVTDAGYYDRTVEKIVPAKVKAVKIHVHRYWCPNCKKMVYAPVKDAFDNSRFGVETYLLIAYLKMGLGLTYGKIVELLRIAYGLRISKGALPQMLDTLRDEFGEHYGELIDELRKCPFVNGDETSWRQNGRNRWLWVFVTKWLAVYTIDKSRGKKVPQRMLGKDYEGTIGSDFLGAYNHTGKNWQKGHCHLDRNLRETVKKKPEGNEFHAFKKILARILRDSRTLWKKEKRISVLKEKKIHYEKRVAALCAMKWKDKDCKRLVKRCRRYGKYLFTFLVVKGLTPDNNISERAIKPGVIMRKNSYGSRGENGVVTMPVLLSTIQTCKIRNQNFLDWGKDYLENRLSSTTPKL